MSTAADYVGRTVDVLAFQGKFPRAGDQRLTQSLVDASGYAYSVTGIQKLAQRFLILLLTDRSSQPYRLKARGTSFLAQGRMGLWRTTLDVAQSFAVAVLDVRRTLDAEDQASDSAEEKLGTVQLTGVSLDGDQVTLRVDFRSKAGTTLRYVAPIPITIQ